MPARHVPAPPPAARGTLPITSTDAPPARRAAVPAATDAFDLVPAATGAFDLVLVGGVPGAGKTTAIARATDDLTHVCSVDPEHVSWWLRSRLPGVPYRGYRWLVHLVHTLRVLVGLLDGPRPGRRLVIHDPGTRTGRRRLFLGLARLAGWRTVLVYVDVDRPAAQDGQRRRGRVVRSFDEHWQSWQQLRPALVASTSPSDRATRAALAPARSTVGDPPRSESVVLTDRTQAADVLRALLET